MADRGGYVNENRRRLEGGCGVVGEAGEARGALLQEARDAWQSSAGTPRVIHGRQVEYDDVVVQPAGTRRGDIEPQTQEAAGE